MAYRFRTLKEMKADLVTELEAVTLVDTSTTAFANVESYAAVSWSGVFEMLESSPAPAAVIAVGGGIFEPDGARNQRRGNIEIFISGDYTNRLNIDDEFDAFTLGEAVEAHFMIDNGNTGRYDEFKLNGVNYEVAGLQPVDTDEGFNWAVLTLEFMDFRQHRNSLAVVA